MVRERTGPAPEEFGDDELDDVMGAGIADAVGAKIGRVGKIVSVASGDPVGFASNLAGSVKDGANKFGGAVAETVSAGVNDWLDEEATSDDTK